jgi:predicted Zn-dependent protease with MMP-like domain
MSADWESLLGIAQDEVRKIIRELPTDLREQAATLPLTFEAKPGEGWIKDGIESDTLGLFVGSAFKDAGHESHPLPPQIFLFLENTWDFSGANEATYREELRCTYLHELGHYLGLDEDDLDERGLL